MTQYKILKRRHQFPVSVGLDRAGKLLVRGVSRPMLPTRELRSDEGVRSLVGELLGIKIGARPVLVTFREACKLYALAWLLADLVPEDPTWMRVLARFAKRLGRAGSLWEHTTTHFDCAETARLFRALVFGERHRGSSSNRIVIAHPDFDVLTKATAWDLDHYLYLRRFLPIRRHLLMASSKASALPPALPPATADRGQWAGVICPEPGALLLMPVDHRRRPKPGYHAIVTNIQDLRIPDQGQGKRTRAAQALEGLAERIEAADPSISAHSLIAMQGPLLVAAEELKAGTRRRQA
jgi:hypothetical protein